MNPNEPEAQAKQEPCTPPLLDARTASYVRPHSLRTNPESALKPQPAAIANADIDPRALQSLVRLAGELARHGREGRAVGTALIIGDSSEVMRRSRPLIPNPLAALSEEESNIRHPETRETVAELSQLDGAFVLDAEGDVVSGARCLDVETRDIDLPSGLGSRHYAAASITQATNALAVVVSQSSSTVRMFADGEIVSRWSFA